MKDKLAKAFGAMTLFSFIAALRENARRSYEKKPGKGYVPAGPHANVRGTYVRNPKVAAQINSMHERWFSARFA